MKKTHIYNEISEIIAHEILEIITPAEEEKLRQWLGECDTNQEIYGRIKAHVETLPEKSYMTDAEVRRAWREFAPNAAKARRAKRRGLALRYAAVSVIVAGCGWFVLDRVLPENGSPTITVTQMAEGDDRRVTLTRPDGSLVFLDAGADDWVDANATAGDAWGDLPAPGGSPEAEDIYATITVPRGSTFKTVVLDDVRVYFNSGSELRYQVNITGDHRKFFVKGEVFFDIDKPLKTPIHVYPSDDVCIRVLGTSFNVKAYGDEDDITTTLVTGRLEVRGVNMTTILAPSEQLIYNKTDESLSKQRVDTRMSTAWMAGRFVFENETLGQILRRISRWYDVEITCSDQMLLNNRFTGDLDWYDNLETLLRMLEKVTNIKMEVGVS